MPVNTDPTPGNSPIVYNAQQEFPEQIIRSIALSQGLTLAGDLSPRARQNPVTGKLVASKLSDLIDQLGRRHGFDHFIHGASIYLYDSADWRTETIPLGFRPDDQFRENLKQYGLLFSNFRLFIKPEDESVVVTAPRQYIGLLDKSIKNSRDSPQAEMLIFRLRHASAEDRSMTLRDRPVITPGVVSILRGLVGEAPLPSGAVAAQGPQASVTAAGLPNAAVAGPLQALPVAGISAGGPLSETAGQGSQLMGGASQGVTSPSGRSAVPIQRPSIFIAADVRTNSVIIRDRRAKEPEWRRLIEQLDVPQEMVEIEAVLIDIDQRRLDQLGVEWGFRNNVLSAEFPGASVDGVSLSRGSTALITDGSAFAARLRALVADNDAKVLAKPTILTHNNLSGVIDLTQTYFTRVSGERVANLIPVVAGSLLRVTPRIIEPERSIGPTQVQLTIEIEDGSLKDRAGLDLPTVQKNAITTQASILTDQSILIGGYTRETEETVNYKIPVLGDLPYIGRIMRSQSRTAQVMTRLFLITPRLVSVNQSGHLKPKLDRSLELKRSDDLKRLLPP